MNNTHSNSVFETSNLRVNYLRTNELGTSSVKSRYEGLINSNILSQMTSGQIPDLSDVCLELADTFNHTDAPNSAIQFTQVLQKMPDFKPDQVKRFIENPETRHVLVSSDLFEVVLNHWKPGKASDIHGHPEGGCLFKLLHGRLEELRFAPQKSPKILSATNLRTGSMMYIDDRIGYHQVGNPYRFSAISIHAYLK